MRQAHASLRVGGHRRSGPADDEQRALLGLSRPGIHWVYFTPLRQNGPLWTEFIIWSSLIGCVMCVTGPGVGRLCAFHRSRRFRLKRVPAHSPYAGMMKWHHYAGLLFGVITLTWTYSGLLSMGPFNWFQPAGGRGGAPRRNARPERACRSRPSRSTGMRAAHDAFSPVLRAQVAWSSSQFQGELYLGGRRAPRRCRRPIGGASPSLLPRATAAASRAAIRRRLSSGGRHVHELPEGRDGRGRTRHDARRSRWRIRSGSRHTTATTTIRARRVRCRCCASATTTRRRPGSTLTRRVARSFSGTRRSPGCAAGCIRDCTASTSRSSITSDRSGTLSSSSSASAGRC